MDKLLELFTVFGPILFALSVLALIVKHRLHWFFMGEKKKIAKQLNKYQNNKISKGEFVNWIIKSSQQEKRLAKLKELKKYVVE